jgi:uncharacterized protein (TIRG00374 family)
MKILRWVVALLVSGGGIWFALHGVQWTEVGAALNGVRSPWLLFFVPLSAGLEYALRTERWRLLLADSRKYWLSLFPIVAGAFFMNIVLPFRAGEAARIFWTHRQRNRPLPGTVAALAVDRLMDSFALVVLFLTALAFRPGIPIPRGAVLSLLAIGFSGLAFFVVLARNSDRVGGKVTALPLPRFFHRILNSFIEGAAPLRSFQTLGATLLISGLLWSFIVGIFWGVGWLFGLPFTWAEATLLVAGIALGVALPSTPGFIGTYEAAGVGVLSLLGYEKSVAFPFVVSIHLIQILGTTLWGVPSVWIMVRSREKKVLEDL